MVNFHDPIVITKDRLAVLKLWHVMAGLYIWEVVTTLDYEWSVLRGHRPYRWTIWIYCLTRVAALTAITLNLISDNVMSRFNCEIEIIFELIFGYLAFATASLLIVLRIIVIWNKKKIIIAIATILWVINVALIINGKPYFLPTSGSPTRACPGARYRADSFKMGTLRGQLPAGYWQRSECQS